MTSIDLSHPAEKALSDLRRGAAICIRDLDATYLVAMAETMSSNAIASITSFTGNLPHFIVPAKRLEYLFPEHSFPEIASLGFESLEACSEATEYLISDALPIVTNKTPIFVPPHINQATTSEHTIISLARHAALLPVMLVWNIPTDISDSPSLEGITQLNLTDINDYPETINASLEAVGEAPLTLRDVPDCKIIAYRSAAGGHEHYALIIKNALDQHAPLVRIHSSCYTGDLLGSLRCDCQDQLQSAIQQMGEEDGGIIIYLMQEGRGIGLVNKLRTYSLQSQGLDTVDANAALGFDDDERLFLPAATILKSLDINTIKLLSNNPRKAAGVESHGIKVDSCVPHIMTAHEHNKDYLETKKTRLGHKFD